MWAFLPPFTDVLPGHARHHGHAGDCVCDCDGAHVCGCGDPEQRKVKPIRRSFNKILVLTYIEKKAA